MGGKLSTESDGIDEGCEGCKVRLPPANPHFDFWKACDGSDKATYCFWTEQEYPITITHGINVGTDGESAEVGFSSSVQIKKGERLFKYFRRMGYSAYWCAKCFAENRPLIAKSVFLELSGHGQIVSTDMKLVKMGSR